MAKKILIIAGILGCICITPIASYTYGDVSVEAYSANDTTENNDNIIIFDPAYTVVDDENLKLQITSVQKSILNEGMKDFESTEYSINLNIENKNQEHDIDVSVSTESCYIDGYTVQFANSNSKTKR